MYDNVIVPFGSGLGLRAALAPAADLAWRCGAKVVVVSTTAAADEQSRLLLKTQAISMSGDDIDFWIDLESEIGDALVDAATHRSNPVICVASRYRTSGWLGRKQSVVPAPQQVFTDTMAPVVVIGPEADMSRGLNVTEVVVLDDGHSAAVPARDLAMQWAIRLKLSMCVVGVVAPDAEEPERVLEDFRRDFAHVRACVPQSSLEVIQASDPAAAFCEILDDRADALGVVVTRTYGDDGPLGQVAAAVLERSARPVLFAKPIF